MITLVKQPSELSFSRNPIVYRFRTTDIAGSPYGAVGYRGRILFQGSPVPQLLTNEEFVITWSDGESSSSYTFSGHPAPSSPNQLSSFGTTPQAYAQLWIDTFESHPVISAVFNLELYTFGSFAGIIFEDKTLNPDFTLEFDFSDASEFASSNFLYQDYEYSNIPENYSIKIDVYFQPEYNEGVYKHVTRLESIPDSDGYSEIDLSGILDAEIKNIEKTLPVINSSVLTIAKNLRNFYIRFSEHYGTPSEEQSYEFTETKLIINGGIDQSRFASSNFFAQLSITNSILSWYPDKKVVSQDQPEYLSWFNYTDSRKEICIRLTTYDETNTDTETILYNDDFLSVESNQTAIIPVGFSQLGMSNDTIKKYTIQVVTSIPADVPVQREDMSQVRTYYVDCNYRYCEKAILYFDGFDLPAVVRLTGATKKQLSVTRSITYSILPPEYENTTHESFQYDFDWSNLLTFRSGFLRKEEVDALQQLLIYNQSFEITDNQYYPLIITDKKYDITECFQFLHSLQFQAIRALSPKNYSNDIIPTGDCCPGTSLCIGDQVITFNSLIITY